MDIKNPERRSVAHNVMMNAIVMTSSFILPLITVPYISRVLLEYGNGLVSFAQNFVYYFAVIASMGVASYGVVACSRVRDDNNEFSRTTLEILIVLVAASVMMSGLYLALVTFLPRFGDARSLYIFMVSSIWTTAFSLEWFYQSIEQYGYITKRALIVRTIGTICIFIFVKGIDDYLIYVCITVLTQGASCLINLLRMRKYVDIAAIRDVTPLRHIGPMFTYLVMNVSKGMANKSDILVLGFMGTAEMVGIYQIASKIENMIVAAVESVGSVLLPRLTSYKSHGADDQYSGLLAYGIDFALIIGCYALGGTVLCANSIVSLLGGEAYMGAVMPLIATAPAVLFAAGTNVISQVLLINSKENLFAITNLVGLVVSVGSAIILIPTLGITGSGLAVSIAQSSIFILAVIFARRYLQSALSQSDCGRIIIAATVATLIGYVASCILPSFHAFIQLLVIGGLFTLAFAAVLIITKEKLVGTLISRLMRNRNHF